MCNACPNRQQYDAGPVDGVYGSRTRTAIEAAQHDAGLPGTGEPDLDTLAALKAAACSEPG